MSLLETTLRITSVISVAHLEYFTGGGRSDPETIRVYRSLIANMAQPKNCPFELNTRIELKKYNYIRQ